MTGARKGAFFCNPILDIVVPCGEKAWYEKWQVEPGSYQEYRKEKHEGIYEWMLSQPEAQKFPGGSGQNSAAVYASIVERLFPGSDAAHYYGCVGGTADGELDSYAKIMQEAARGRSLNTKYQVTTAAPTGTCAIAIDQTTRDRVLVTNLGATAHYSQEHIQREAQMGAPYGLVHVTGFFITATAEGMKALCKSVGKGKKDTVLSVCFSAPFVLQFFTEPLWECLKEADVISGNEDEWVAAQKVLAGRVGYASREEDAAAALDDAFLRQFAKATGALCICTCGEKDTICCNPTEEGEPVRRFPVGKVPKELIQDTNGCGDAFIGGVLTAIGLGADWRDENCEEFSPLQNVTRMIEFGHTCAKDCLSRLAFQYDPDTLTNIARAVFIRK